MTTIQFKHNFGIGWLARVGETGPWLRMHLDGSRMELHPLPEEPPGTAFATGSYITGEDRSLTPFDEVAADFRRMRAARDEEKARVAAYMKLIVRLIGKKKAEALVLPKPAKAKAAKAKAAPKKRRSKKVVRRRSRR